ncbi:MAG: sarcosine oxidase subunit beta family protein [Gammaproteobacteria bacterium]|nr:sarcosine oxidase subunit beta family protein [Gammaproteobacteria bacterium]
MHYSGFSLLKQALTGNRGWTRTWRNLEPRKRYDVVIIGGGGHGLATAYYLAKMHGITDVAVLEKGYIGSGNTGRNTTIVRSNYMLNPNAQFYEHSMKLWEGLSQDLNYNVMFSQRGVLNLIHNDAQRDAFARRGNSLRLNGIDAVMHDLEGVKKLMPHLDFSKNTRFPVQGGLAQPRGGTARHDAVAWGYARAADRLGVEIFQKCEVTAIKRKGDKIITVETTRGPIEAGQVGVAVAGNSSRLFNMVGMNLPIESHVLQAFVTEGIKPLVDTVCTFGAGHFYISQSDKGGLVFGGDLDGWNTYAQRGNLPTFNHVVAGGVTMMPCLARLRVLRQWGGVMDMSMDGSPIIGKTPIDNLYLNGGWCYGGFKATPASGWVFAHTIAHDKPHALNAEFTLERFREGNLIDEKGVGASPKSH